MGTVKKIFIMVGIVCLALVVARYREEGKELRKSEKLILQTQRYLQELNVFLQKIAEMNKDLSAIFYRSLKEKEPDSKQFNTQLNDIYLELKTQKIKLEKVLIGLEKSGRHSNWWLVKSHKDRCPLNQLSIDFYKQGLETLNHQLADAVKAIKEYLAFWPNFGVGMNKSAVQLPNKRTHKPRAS
ncbi:MAG TPA: hypothetical protein EYP21_02405 [Syntrophaceae bacterium]|nr:hypothetical protein [Syntrophaceae bacterium]